MAYTSGFFDAVDQGGGDYDREYSAEVFAHYFSRFIKNGVFPDPSTGLQVRASSSPNMNVSVQPGDGWINGYYITVDELSPEVLTVPTANPSLSRIDSVIMGLNLIDREIQLYIKSGAVSSGPSPVSLQRDSDLYELELAQITVSAGAASITQSNIKDMRQDSSRCGIVKGTIEQIDTTDLFAQYDDAFQTWFNDLQEQLSGDIATNLQNQINALKVTPETAQKYGLEEATPDQLFGLLPEYFEPVGTIKTTVRTDLGENWLLCNGDTVSTIEYPELGEVIEPRLNINIDNKLWEESNSDITPYYWGGKYFRFNRVLGTNQITYSNTINGSYSKFNFGFSRQYAVKKVKEYNGKLCILLFTPTDYDAPDVCNLLILNSDLTYRLIALNFDSAGRTPNGPIDFAFGTTHFILLDNYVSGYYLRYYYGQMPSLDNSGSVEMQYKNLNDSYPWSYNAVLYNNDQKKFYLFVYYSGTDGRVIVIEESVLASGGTSFSSNSLRYNNSSSLSTYENTIVIDIGDYVIVTGSQVIGVFTFDALNGKNGASNAKSVASVIISSYNYAPYNVNGVMVKSVENGHEIYVATGKNYSDTLYVVKISVSNDGGINAEDLFSANKNDFGVNQIFAGICGGVFELGEYYAFYVYLNYDGSIGVKYTWFYGLKNSIQLPTISTDGAYNYIKAKEV